MRCLNILAMSHSDTLCDRSSHLPRIVQHHLNAAPEPTPLAAEPTMSGSAENSTVFESRSKGENLHNKLSPCDSFLEDLKVTYAADPLYQKILEHPDHHSAFKLEDGLLWTIDQE